MKAQIKKAALLLAPFAVAAGETFVEALSTSAPLSKASLAHAAVAALLADLALVKLMLAGAPAQKSTEVK